MLRLFSALVKIGLASLITGAVLSALNLSAAELLAEIGLTPDRVFEALQNGAAWAIPNIVLGSMVIVPIWFVTYLLRPPRNQTGGRLPSPTPPSRARPSPTRSSTIRSMPNSRHGPPTWLRRSLSPRRRPTGL